MEDLQNKIIQLESKIAFQDRTIELMNEALISQQNQIEKLSSQLKSIKEMLSSESHIKRSDEEVPPPHSSRNR